MKFALSPRWLIIFIVLTLAAGLASGLLGCVKQNVHPGLKVMRAKCGACHTLRERAELRKKGVDRVIELHRNRLKLDHAQRDQIKSYVESAP